MRLRRKGWQTCKILNQARVLIDMENEPSRKPELIHRLLTRPLHPEIREFLFGCELQGFTLNGWNFINLTVPNKLVRFYSDELYEEIQGSLDDDMIAIDVYGDFPPPDCTATIYAYRP